MTVPDALSRAFNEKEESLGVWHDIEHSSCTKLNPQVGILNAKEPMETNINFTDTDMKSEENIEDDIYWSTPVGTKLDDEIDELLKAFNKRDEQNTRWKRKAQEYSSLL